MFEFERDYWNLRYLNHDPRGSGAGSYGEPMWRKVDAIAALPFISSIIDIGCGDWNFGKYLTEKMPTARYLGLDVSNAVIERNEARHKSELIGFSTFGEENLQYQLFADLIVCSDVLFHIVDDDAYLKMLRLLKSSNWRYLALTAYEYDGPSDRHLRIRRFDPKYFGEPILQETIEEPGSMQFYIFKK